MSTAVADIIADGGVDPAYLETQYESLIDQMKSMTQDAEGNDVKLSEAEGVKFDFMKEQAEKYKAEYEKAVTSSKGRLDDARMQALAELGKGLRPEIDPALDDREMMGKNLAAMPTSKSPVGHLLANREFVKFVADNHDNEGRFVLQAGQSKSFSAGPIGDFLRHPQTKGLISTVGGENGDPNSQLYDSETGEFLGTYFELPSKEPVLKDLSLFDCIQTTVINSKHVRWIEMERAKLNVGVHVEEATKEETKHKPYSMLGPKQVHEDVLTTIAHMFCATTCALDDIERLEQIINEWGRYGLRERLCEAMLSGDPETNPNDPFVGLLNTPGIGAIDSSDENFSLLDPVWQKIMWARVQIKQNKFAADKALMNCITATRLAIEGANDDGCCIYNFVNPITGQQTQSVAGLQIVEIEDMPDGDILVGGFGSQNIGLYTNGDADVRFTDSHDDHFGKNIVDWRFEMNGLLAVRCPQAFTVLDTKA